jgi:hypothetical protein
VITIGMTTTSASIPWNKCRNVCLLSKKKLQLLIVASYHICKFHEDPRKLFSRFLFWPSYSYMWHHYSFFWTFLIYFVCVFTILTYIIMLKWMQHQVDSLGVSESDYRNNLLFLAPFYCYWYISSTRCYSNQKLSINSHIFNRGS